MIQYFSVFKNSVISTFSDIQQWATVVRTTCEGAKHHVVLSPQASHRHNLYVVYSSRLRLSLQNLGRSLSFLLWLGAWWRDCYCESSLLVLRIIPRNTQLGYHVPHFSNSQRLPYLKPFSPLISSICTASIWSWQSCNSCEFEDGLHLCLHYVHVNYGHH